MAMRGLTEIHPFLLLPLPTTEEEDDEEEEEEEATLKVKPLNALLEAITPLLSLFSIKPNSKPETNYSSLVALLHTPAPPLFSYHNLWPWVLAQTWRFEGDRESNE